MNEPIKYTLSAYLEYLNNLEPKTIFPLYKAMELIAFAKRQLREDLIKWLYSFGEDEESAHEEKPNQANCPICGTLCTIEGIGDFDNKDVISTVHYKPIEEEFDSKPIPPKSRIRLNIKLEEITSAYVFQGRLSDCCNAPVVLIENKNDMCGTWCDKCHKSCGFIRINQKENE